MKINLEQYQPGQVNINHKEADTRRESAVLSTLFSLISFSFLVLVSADMIYYAFLLPSVWLATLGYLQSSRYFCVRFGFRGRQNADGTYYSPKSIISDDAKAQDKKQAMIITGSATIISLTITVLLALLSKNLL